MSVPIFTPLAKNSTLATLPSASDAVAALRVVLTCLPDVTFEQLEMKSLRIYLNGESNLVHSLYELLCNNTTQILLREANPNSKKQPVVLPGGFPN